MVFISLAIMHACSDSELFCYTSLVCSEEDYHNGEGDDDDDGDYDYAPAA